MTTTKYTYLISSDFPNHKVTTSRLVQEIQISAIVVALDYINTSGNDCDIWFKDELTANDKIILDGIVAVHSGESLPDIGVITITTVNKTVNGTPIVYSGAPQESDGRIVIVNSPSREGSYTWLCSHGDDLTPTPPSSGRGEGNQALLTFTGPDTKEVEISFCEAMQLHNGHVSWRPIENWDFEDKWNLFVRIPATVATPNVVNTGNCNLVSTGIGFNIIVPAGGDGAYDIDLEAAVPVPDGYSVSLDEGTGYWNVDRFWSEVVTPNLEGKGEFNFYDLQLEFYFCKNMDCGCPNGSWDLNSYKAEWISSKWKPVFKATKVTAGTGKIGGYFMVFRPGAV